MSNVDSLLEFLDNAENRSLNVQIPTDEQMKRKRKQKEILLQKQIQQLKINIEEFQKMKQKITEQNEKYQFSIMKIQASMDRTIREKEEISKQIEDLSFQNENLNKIQNVDSQKKINEEIKQAVDEAVNKLRDQLPTKLQKLKSSIIAQAHLEFSPHIAQLKSKHLADLETLKTQLNKEKEIITQTYLTSLNQSLGSIRKKFYDQTENQIKLINQQNEKSLDSLRSKNNRETVQYEKDIDRIVQSTTTDVKEIKARYQREYDRERSKMIRLIEECRNDAIFAKRRGDAQIKEYQEKYKKNESLYTKVLEVSPDTEFEVQNQKRIKMHKKLLQNELNDYRTQINDDIENEIEKIKLDIDREIRSLSNEIEYINQEIERLSNLKEKENSFRLRQEKYTLSLKKELTSVTDSIFLLKDQLFNLKTELCEEESNLNKTKELIKHNELCNHLKDEINKVKQEKEIAMKTHENEIEVLQNKHKNTISSTFNRVKSIIEAKTQQIAKLNEQYQIEKEKIDLLAGAIH